MANIMRLRVSWSGSPVVGPGLSTFYQAQAAPVGFADSIAAFFGQLAPAVASGVQWSIPSNGDVIDDATGDIVASWSEPGTGGTIASSGSAGFVNGTGARIVWNTDGIFRGRRVRGTTFVVPMPTNAFEGSGNLTSAAITVLQDAANAQIAANSDMLIWSRPVELTPGESNAIVSASVPDQVSWLRSRRT